MTRIATRHFDEPRLHELETYRRLGGYEGLKKALAMRPEEIAAEVKKSNLRGLGGAGFPAALKWSTLPPLDKVPGPRFVVGNCDESEPGCFRDRVCVERNPHLLLEGILVASHAVGATFGDRQHDRGGAGSVRSGRSFRPMNLPNGGSSGSLGR